MFAFHLFQLYLKIFFQLKVNETLREKRLIDKAFPIDVRSCRSTYRYRKPFGEEYQMYLSIINFKTFNKKFMQDFSYYFSVRTNILEIQLKYSNDE